MQSIEVTFPKQNYNGHRTVQFILTIDYQNGSSIVPYSASHFDLLIEKYGNIALKFDINDYLLVPSSFSVTIGDVQGTFEEKLFPTDENNIKITGKLYIDGNLEFEGDYIPEKLSYNSKRKINIGFSSNTNLLNETMLTDSSGNATDPLAFNNSAKTLNDAILDCYKLVNPAVNLTVKHNWLHYENLNDSQSYNWDDLYTTYHKFYVGDTIGSSLKKVAQRKFSFTGMVNNSKAFFTHLYYYNSNNVQELDIKAYRRGVGYPNLDYVVVKNDDNSILLELPDSNAYTTVQGKFLEFKENIWYNGTPIVDYILRNGALYSINSVKTPDLPQQYYQYEVPARMHYNFRKDSIFNWIDTFIVDGVHADYLKNFHFQNRKYQILSMTKFIGDGKTEIEALYLGELAS